MNHPSPDFSKGLLPCIVQDALSKTVLMLGYMNEEAYQKTLAEKHVTFFSRSKNRLWTKGETSGNKLQVVDIRTDCDRDTLLILANPTGPVCHTGADTCFDEKNLLTSVDWLERIIAERKQSPHPDSYTSRLFGNGIKKIAQKVGEEAVELVIEASDDNRDLLVNEAADLLFHYLVLLQAKDVSMKDVVARLRSRHRPTAP